MKIACIMPHSYEKYYLRELVSMNSCDDLDIQILSKVDSCEHKICRSLKMAGMEPTLYYMSSISKRVSQFRHKYGHLMKKIPVSFKIGNYGLYGSEFSKKLFNELSADLNDLVLIYTYTLGNVIPVDMYDLLAFNLNRKKIPFIARHGGGSAKPVFRGITVLYKKWIKQKTLNMACLIIVPSSSEASTLNKELGINPEKILVLKDPLDFENICEYSKEKAAVNLNRDAGKKYILYVGRISEPKGIRHIINCMPDLLKENKDVILLIVGTGPEEKELKKLTDDMDLSDKVSFEGFVFHDKLGDYYNLADVLVLPSYSEGTPNVIQEAVAFNVPCVSTSVGGIPDLLSEGVGIIIPPRNEYELYKGVNRILTGDFSVNQKKRNKLLNEWNMEYYGERVKEALVNKGLYTESGIII